MFAALAYAVLTEPHLLALKPQVALLSMLIVPVIFLLTFFFVLTPAPTVYRITMSRLSTWIVPSNKHQVMPADPNEKVAPVWTTLEDGSSGSDPSSEASSVNIKGKLEFRIV